jgi:hypothetical protein
MQQSGYTPPASRSFSTTEEKPNPNKLGPILNAFYGPPELFYGAPAGE